MSKYVNVGQFELDYLSVEINRVVVDLKNAMVELILYENILSPVLMGTVLISEGDNLVNNYGLGYGDRLTFKYATPSFDKKEVNAIVYKVSEPNRISEKNSSYNIYFASEELIKNVGVNVQKGYELEPHLIAQDIFKTIKSQKKSLKVEPTTLDHIVFPKLKPLDAIALCCKRSKSTSGKSGYIFYEDIEKFNMVPIEKLYEQKPIMEYSYRSGNIYDNVDQRHKEAFSSYQNYKILEPYSFMEQLNKGIFGTKVQYFNLDDKKVVEYKFNRDKIKPLGEHKNHHDVEEKEYVNEFHINNFDGMYQENWINNKYVLDTHSDLAVSISVLGNSDLMVGSIVNVTVPYWSANNTKDDKDLLSGKFLISEIKHVFRIDGYSQVLKLVKNSYEETYG